MIKGIPPSDKKTQETEVGKPNTNAVPQEVSEQFSSLLHKKEPLQSKELPKSKNKIDQFLNKIEDGLTKQVSQAKIPKRQQAPDSKHQKTSDEMPGQKPEISADKKQHQAPDSNHKKASDEMPGQKPEISADKKQHQTPDSNHKKASDEMPRQKPEISADKKQHQAPDSNHKKTSDEMPRQKPEISADKKQHQTPDSNHKKTSDEMPRQKPESSADKSKPPIHKQSTHSKQEPSSNKDLPQSLDAFDIASMIAQSQAPLQSTAPIEKAAPTPPTDLNKIVGEIAERILVSSPADNPSGVQEIRIHLKESVLPNTEVRIYRNAGSLQIEFVTNSKDSQMFIEQRQPDIQKVLSERLTDETVTVSVQDGQQTRGGQGEGRSRQQYIHPDQDDD